MGACYSSPIVLSKRTKNHNSISSIINEDSIRRQSIASQLASILKNPSGNDLSVRYRLGKELGRGEFGITYQCMDLETGETLACKSIAKSRIHTQIDLEDVQREAEIMRMLPKHPNIVSLREAYEDKDAVCHENGVMHRDLKPENFLFANKDESSPLKAIDFGLSVFFEPGQLFKEIVGSPFYMAPEVLRRNYGPQVDVWSAGVILYILLCGVPPFWAATEEGIAQAIVRSVVSFDRDPWPKVSEDAKDLVRGMLDPNPYSRLTAQEVLDHNWLRNAKIKKLSCVSLGENVCARIKQFCLINKFKKKAWRVVADNLPKDQIAGIKQIFRMMDTDENGLLTFEELKDGLYMIGDPVPHPNFQMLSDAAENGTLTSGEFVSISLQLKKVSNDEYLCKAFKYFDKNGSGFIEFEELIEDLREDDLGPECENVIHDTIRDVDTDEDGKISYDEFKAMMTAGTDWRMASRQYSRVLLNTLSHRLLKDTSKQPRK
ncbi:hypothetical protein Scep_029225 [Stephania cephalantha]|uniref:non-specific serine/threonine protein kinase n=1 Tax=Stephania cephalantha TaxID=152367 RepID=A0AAP0HDC0_9MAGN